MNFKDIIADKTSGSSTILEKTILELVSYLQKESDSEYRLLNTELFGLFKAHPNFAVLFHFINSFFLETKHNPEPSSLLNFIAEYRKKWSDSIIHACKNLIYHEEFGSRTILVHSNSSAIHLLFRLAGDQGLHTKVIQTISGPGNEGKVQAEILSKLGFEVDLIHENAAGKFMREIDFAVFGADVIIEDYFINKAGTLQLSLLCNFYQKPVYVIADSRKLIHAAVLSEVLKKMILQEPVKPTEELWLNPPANVKPVNYWFESTPLDLITELVTEKGLLKPNKVSGMAKSTPISDLFHEELMK